MTKLLQFTIKFLSALFDEYGFSIASSENSGNDFAGASMVIASSEMEIFLAIERQEITAQFRSAFDKKKSNWYSAGTVLDLVGHKDCPGLLDDRTGSYIKDALPVIVSLFKQAEIERTLERLDEIERERSKRMW